MRKCVITGGAGFIGSNLAEKLVDLGYKVTLIDNFSNGKIDNIKSILKKITLIRGDIRNKTTLDKVFRGADFIVHLAAITSTTRSIKDPEETKDVNINGTINVLSAARKNKIKRILFASSAAVYGDLRELPKKETTDTMPLSPYATSKLAGEHLCMLYNNQFGLNTVIYRFFNVYGPKQDPKSPYSGAISIFIDKLLNGKRPVIYGDGKQTRDFVYIDDLISVIVRSLTLKKKNIFGNVYNIATGKDVSIKRTLEILGKIFKRRIDPIYKKPRKGDIKYSAACIDKARRILGYRPRASFEYGLRKTVDWAVNRS